MDPGQVVEFIEDRKFIVGVCIQSKGERINALTHEGREVNLNTSRIIHISSEHLSLTEPRSGLLENLQTHDSLRNKLKQNINLQELWDLVQGDEESFDVFFLADIIFGNHTASDHEAALLRAILENKIYFRYHQGRISVCDSEKVERLLAQRQQEERRDQELEEAANWLKATWLGEEAGSLEDKHFIIESLKQVSLGDTTRPLFKYGKELLERAGLDGDGKAFDILVRFGVWHPDQNLDLLRQEIPTEYPPGVYQDAERAMAQNMLDLHKFKRLDLTDENIITIDGMATRDFDDALSLVKTSFGYRLGIHIADVSTYISKETPMDRHARLLGTSVYLPDDRISMFPQGIADNLCSLREGEKRLALSLLVDLNAEGKTLNFSFYPSVIRVNKRLTYQEVDLLGGKGPVVEDLAKLSSVLLRNRMENGALVQPPYEIAVWVDSSGEVFVRKIERDSVSRTIVAESMVLANTLAARTLKEKGIPCLFRSQEEPTDRLKGDFDNDPYLLYRQRTLLKRIVIDTEPLAHSGLGVDVYTHMTSPIRRYMDLVIQRQLLAMLDDQFQPYTSEELKALALEIEPALKRVNLVRQRRQRYWLIRYFEHMIGEKTQAVVLKRFPKYCRISLTDYLLECSLQKQGNISLIPGDHILVRFEKAKARDDVLKVSLI
jgi:exoribonuclease II